MAKSKRKTKRAASKRKKMPLIIRRSVQMVAALAVICASSILFLLISLKNEAHELPLLNSYFERKAQAALRDYDVSLKATKVWWRSDVNEVIVNLEELKAHHQDQDLNFELPQLTIDFHYRSLWSFDIVDMMLLLDQPKFEYKTTKSKDHAAKIYLEMPVTAQESTSKGIATSTSADSSASKSTELPKSSWYENISFFSEPIVPKYLKAAYDVLNQGFITNKFTLEVKSLAVNLVINDKKLNTVIPKTVLTWQDHQQVKKLALVLKGHQNDQQIYIDAAAKLQEDQFTSYLYMNNLPTSLFSPLLLTDGESFIDVNLNSKISLSSHLVDGEPVVDDFNVRVFDSSGKLKLKKMSDAEYRLSDVTLAMHHNQSTNQVMIDTAKLTINDAAKISGVGKVNLSPHDHLAEFELAMNDLSFNDLLAVWPPYLASGARKWMDKHFEGGMVSNIIFELALDKYGHLILDDNNPIASLNLGSLTLNYLKQFPALSNVNADCKLFTKRAEINIKDARAEATSVLGFVSIPYNNSEQATIRVKTQGIIQNLFKYFKNAAVIEKYLPKSQLKGNVESVVNIDIPLKGQVQYEDINFDVKLNGTDITGALVLPNSKALNFVIKQIKSFFNGKVIEVLLQGELAKQELDLKLDISPTGMVKMAKANITLNDENPDFHKYISKGRVDIAIDLVPGGIFSNDIDIKVIATDHNSVISLPEIDFFKNTSDKLELEVAGRTDLKEQLTINDLKLAAGKNIISGKLLYNLKRKKISSVELDKFATSNNDFNFSLERDENITKTNLSGKKLAVTKDLVKLIKGNKKSSEPNIIQAKDLDEDPATLNQVLDEIEPMSNANSHRRVLNFAVDELQIPSGSVINKPKLLLDCDHLNCHQIMMDVHLNEEKFIIVDLDKAKKTLIVDGKNIGGILSELKLTSNIKGGDIYFKTLPDDGTNISGDFKIVDFSLTTNSVLAKILALTSVPSITKLSSKDISFRKANGKFELDGKSLNLRKVRFYGDQLGITSQGFLNFDQKTMLLKGEIYPAIYGFNSVLSNIPLIGMILTGGDNTGIFSASYRITGKMSKPKYRINPFSIIKPGILRNIF